MEGSIVQSLSAVLIAGGALFLASLTPGMAMPASDLAQLSQDVVSRDAATPAQIVACRSKRCDEWRPSYRYSYPRALTIPRVYCGGCAPTWVDCWTYPYGAWYQPPGSEGYVGWPFY
jgi:hypothetical protein